MKRPLRVIDISIETAIDNPVRSGIPSHIAEGVAKSFQTIREGKGAQALDTLAQLIGRPPLTFKDWCPNHLNKFV